MQKNMNTSNSSERMREEGVNKEGKRKECNKREK